MLIRKRKEKKKERNSVQKTSFKDFYYKMDHWKTTVLFEVQGLHTKQTEPLEFSRVDSLILAENLHACGHWVRHEKEKKKKNSKWKSKKKKRYVLLELESQSRTKSSISARGFRRFPLISLLQKFPLLRFCSIFLNLSTHVSNILPFDKSEGEFGFSSAVEWITVNPFIHHAISILLRWFH